MYIIYGDNGGRFPNCHTYLLFEGKDIVAFDPQCGIHLLEKGLNTMGKSWKNIKYIINTHFHADHTASNAFIKERKPDIQILIHKDDAKGIESTEEYFSRYGLNGEAKTHYESIFKYIGYEHSIPDRLLKEGDLIPGGFKVIHTPGHTPGHCCFIRSEVLISGDIDLVGRPWVSNITSSVDDFHKSIRKLLNIEVDIFLPGHGQPIYRRNKIRSELEKYQTRIIKISNKILNLFEGELSLEEIINIRGSGKDIALWSKNPLVGLFRRYDTMNYLHHLEQLGKIKKIEKKGLVLWEKIGGPRGESNPYPSAG